MGVRGRCHLWLVGTFLGWGQLIFSDKEANSQRGGLKIRKARKSQADRINEAERACCLVPTINDKLSYSSCSRGERVAERKTMRGRKQAEGVSTGCRWFSSKSLAHSNKSAKVLQIINRCCTWERGKNQANYQAYVQLRNHPQCKITNWYLIN